MFALFVKLVHFFQALHLMPCDMRKATRFQVTFITLAKSFLNTAISNKPIFFSEVVTNSELPRAYAHRIL
jgi:hypothetical protein